jgi:peptidoglycan/LPS O-acetylase OafA/YrhL
VLLFHAGLGFSGGFVGVDVFFVISGYLITRLVLKELEAGSFTLVDFWSRRIGRILPAAAAMVLATLAAGFFLLLPADYVDLATSAIAQQAMLANVYFWRTTGYFDGPADMKPLLHTWSLAVEEQFYLGYPIMLAVLHKTGRKATAATLCLIAVGSLIISHYGTLRSPSAAFFLLPARAWELILGGLLCFFPTPPRNVLLRESIGAAALASTVAVGWLYDAKTPFPGLAATVPCAATAALIYINSETLTLAGRLLASAPVVMVGLLSYSLYLWHWPVLAFARYWYPSDLPPWAGAVALCGSVALAWLSWAFIEVPFRNTARRAPGMSCFLAAVAALALLVVIGGLIRGCDGFPSRLPESASRFLAEPSYRVKVERPLQAWEAGDLAMIGTAPASERHVDFLVWGDSHASVLADMLDELAKEHGLVAAVAARAAVAPIPGTYNSFQTKEEQLRRNEAVLQYIRRTRTTNVVLIANWQHYEKPAGVFSLREDSRLTASPLPGRELLLARLAQLCGTLADQGIRVWIVLRVPHQPLDPRKRLAASAMLAEVLPVGISRTEWLSTDAATNDGLARLAAGLSHVTIVDPSPACFDDHGMSKIGDASGSFYRDSGHVSPHGAQSLLKAAMTPVLAAIRNRVNAAEPHTPE